MLETTVEVLKVPLIVLGISGILMALGTLVSERRRYLGDSASTGAEDRSDYDPEQKR